jgi:Zn-dependent peptidase ImmA (M78 family)
MSYRRRAEVERQAVDVLRQHGLYSLPIDPVLLANKLGIKVNNAKFADESIASLIAKRGTISRILVEQSDLPYRKRFSIAHELGHHFLHLHADGEIVSKRADMFRQREPTDEPISADRRREIEANWFAAALLMPAELVRAEWMKKPSITHMAHAFNVSEEAMGYRVDTLDLWGPENDL